MTSYRINEIFYSLQGEGFWTGTPAVFVRFSGCNLRCPFCDTAHQAFTPMSADDILSACSEASEDHVLSGTTFASLTPAEHTILLASPQAPVVVLTGGEPGLQVDAALIEALHGAGYRVHIETNGTVVLPGGIDWVTLSPKEDVPGLKGEGRVVLEKADEIKAVYAEGGNPERWASFPAPWHFLQPCDEPGDPAKSRRNTEATVEYIKRHPQWRLSLQTHKYLNIR